MTAVRIGNVTHQMMTKHRGGTKPLEVRCQCGWHLPFRVKTKQAASTRWLGHVQEVPECPRPDKRAYVDEGRAVAALRTIWRRGLVLERSPVRVYECVCGAWHLTSRSGRGIE